MADLVSLLPKGQVSSGSRKVLSSWLLGYLAILLQCATCALLVYALIFGGGDVVVSGCQKIGFYKYCLYNKTLGDCECFSEINDLSLAGGTSKHGLVLAIILTYSSLVIIMVNILTMFFAQCFKEGRLWKFALGLNCLSLVVLSLGMIIFISVNWDLFDISQVTPGFLAVLVALGGMSLLCWIIRHNISLASQMLREVDLFLL